KDSPQGIGSDPAPGVGLREWVHSWAHYSRTAESWRSVWPHQNSTAMEEAFSMTQRICSRSPKAIRRSAADQIAAPGQGPVAQFAEAQGVLAGLKLAQPGAVQYVGDRVGVPGRQAGGRRG